MKTLRKFLALAIIPLMAATVSSCTDYQDEIDALDNRVTRLENLTDVINSQLEVLQRLADALEKADYITGVTENSDGLIINFKKAGSVFIRNGKNGKDGIDAQMPNISMAQAPDGFFYWTLNGEFVLTPDGSLIRANGVDGKDGKDGKAVAPQIRINPTTFYWEVSYDGGTTWISTSVYSKGKDGKDAEAPEITMKQGADGNYYWTVNGVFVLTPDGEMIRANGKDGKDGKAVGPQVRINPTTYFWEVSYDGGITWISTTEYSKGKDGKDGKDAEAPEIAIKKGEDGNYYWTINGVFIITSEGNMVPANGKDGKDGIALAPQVRINPTTYFWEVSYDGGTSWVSTSIYSKGADGKDGKDAEVPEIGMKQGADGNFYWTVNGVFVLTPDGNMVPANGKDGKDGKAVGPQIRINPTTYFWEVSYDGGVTWISTTVYAKGKDGKDGKDAEAPEIGIKQAPDGNYYWTINGTYIVTADGNMVPANGKDGKDGKDGKAVAPKVRINPQTYIWEISYDEGASWISTGTYAIGSDGTDGVDGKDGKDGDVVIKSVQFLVDSQGRDVARFYLATGYFDVPVYYNTDN